MISKNLAKLEYFSSGCQTKPKCIKWIGSDMFIYASKLNVVLMQYNINISRFTTRLLFGEQSCEISCLDSCDINSSESLISVGYCDGTVEIWKVDRSTINVILISTLKQTPTSILLTSISCALETSNVAHILIASGDGMIDIYKMNHISSEILLFLQHRDSCRVLHAASILQINENSELYLLGWDTGDISVCALSFESNPRLESLASLKGCKDWIQEICITKNEDHWLFAACSQDESIIMWSLKLIDTNETKSKPPSSDLEDIFSYGKVHRISLKIGDDPQCVLSLEVKLESVLSAHFNRIYCISWSRNEMNNLSLLSSGMDKTVIQWEYDPDSLIWIDTERIGEITEGELGYLGHASSPDLKHVLAYGFNGSINHYILEDGDWKTNYSITGHFDAVEDISWDCKTGLILSASKDFSLRFHAMIENVHDSSKYWQEIARPLSHGFPLFCCSIISPLQVAVGSEEKLIRIYSPTKLFGSTMRAINRNIEKSHGIDYQQLTLLARSQPLGLLQRAHDPKTDETLNEAQESALVSDYGHFTEDILISRTLWPESSKLFGHTDHVISMAFSQKLSLLATASKGSKEETSSILLWNLEANSPIGSIAFHKLTVTQMEFSPNNSHLLSVSRDRLWLVSKILLDENKKAVVSILCSGRDSLYKHMRIIWTCSWSSDDQYFATGSRDNKIIVWKRVDGDEKWASSQDLVIDTQESVTSIVFHPRPLHLNSNPCHVLVYGMENGLIGFLKLDIKCCKICLIDLCTIPRSVLPRTTVKKILWLVDDCNKNEVSDFDMKIAIASSDCSLRILDIPSEFSLS